MCDVCAETKKLVYKFHTKNSTQKCPTQILSFFVFDFSTTRDEASDVMKNVKSLLGSIYMMNHRNKTYEPIDKNTADRTIVAPKPELVSKHDFSSV